MMDHSSTQTGMGSQQSSPNIKKIVLEYAILTRKAAERYGILRLYNNNNTFYLGGAFQDTLQGIEQVKLRLKEQEVRYSETQGTVKVSMPV